MSRSQLSNLSLATKAGLAIFALVAITVGFLANIHSVKDVKAGAPVYPLSAIVDNAKDFERHDVMVRGTLYSYTQGVMFLKGASSNGLGEDRIRINLPGNYRPSEELQTLLDDLQKFDANNEYKTVEVIASGLFRGGWKGPLVITNIQPLSAITINYLPAEICLIHHQVFEKNFSSLRYKIIEPNKNFHHKYLKAKTSLFPNSRLILEVISGLGDCLNGTGEYSPEVSYCRMCKEEEIKWVKENASGRIPF
jgi:hypothetical protein